jgi:hypothetical protein
MKQVQGELIELLRRTICKIAKAIREVFESFWSHIKEQLEKMKKNLEKLDDTDKRSWQQEQRKAALRSFAEKQRTRYKVQCHRYVNYERYWKAWKGQRR